MAETYHILDYKSLPAQQIATFCYGLRNDSRLKMKLMNSKVSFETLLKAVAVDRLNFIAWSKTKDAQKNMNKPKSIVAGLLQEHTTRNNISFSSPEEYEREKEEILRGGGN